MAKRGSIPLEHPAMIERVPVGAMVVVVAFLRPPEVGEGTPLPSKFAGRLSCPVPDECHYLPCKGAGRRGVIGNPEQYEHVSPSHDADPYFSVSPVHMFNIRERVFIYLNGIIEKTDGETHKIGKTVPFDLI